MSSDVGLTDADRKKLAKLAEDGVDGRTLERELREHEHAERSSRFEWGPDPEKDYCQRCGAGDKQLVRVEGQGQEMNVCEKCHRQLERAAAQAHVPLQVLDAD